MKIDIGNGKILGTKRVSQNGQISGFTEYAGQEVLVVLPEGEPSVKLDAREYAKEMQTAANEHMKLAFGRYKELKKRFETPEKAAREFMHTKAPQTFAGLYDTLDTFVRENVGKAEAKVEKALHRDENGDADAQSAAPAPETATPTGNAKSSGKTPSKEA
jgi:hypothetical protein